MSEDIKPLHFKATRNDAGERYYIACDEAGYTYRISESNKKTRELSWVFTCIRSGSEDTEFVSKFSYLDPNACIAALNEFVTHPEIFQDIVDYLDPYEKDREEAIRCDSSIKRYMANSEWPRDVVIMAKSDESGVEEMSQEEDVFKQGFDARTITINSWDDIPDGHEPLDDSNKTEFYEYLDHIEHLREIYDERNGR